MSSSSGEENVLTEAIEFTNTIHDDLRYLPYFPPSQQRKFNTLKKEAQRIIKYLNAIPIEQMQSNEDKAMYFYLRGKLLAVISSGYNQEEVDHLNDSLALNPNNVDAWICLGTCTMKGGDLNKAKRCFISGLEKYPENKELLCHLSVVERRLSRRDTEVENPEETISESIEHASQALSLDEKDGISWFCLGNAYLTAYFVSGCCNLHMLWKSLKAYKKVVTDEKIRLSPHWFYNCSMTYKFLEYYKVALNGFIAASLSEDGDSAQEEELYNILEEICCHLKKDLNKDTGLPSKTSSVPTVDSLASSLAAVDMDPSFEKATVDSLREGINKGKAVKGEVLFSINNPSKIPSYYVVCGSDRKLFVITVYNVCSTAIKDKDEVTLLNPCYRFIDFIWKGKRYQFKSIRVDSRVDLLVNGAIVSPEHVIHSSMCPQLKEA